MADLPVPDYDSGSGVLTRATLTGAGWTETGTPTDVAGGVECTLSSADGYYRAWTEKDSLWVLDLLMNGTFTQVTSKIVAGLHASSSASALEVIALHGTAGSAEGGEVAIDGVFSKGSLGNPRFYQASGDVMKAVMLARMGSTPRNFQGWFVSPFNEVARYDGTLSATVRANVYLVGGASGIGYTYAATNAAPITIVRVRRYDITPTVAQIKEAVHGEVATFVAGNSATVTTAPVLAFTSKTTTSVTIAVTHAASATGLNIQYRDNRPGSAWTRYTSNPVLAASSSVVISGLTANETYLFKAEPYDIAGSVGLDSNILVVPLVGTEVSF